MIVVLHNMYFHKNDLKKSKSFGEMWRFVALASNFINGFFLFSEKE